MELVGHTPTGMEDIAFQELEEIAGCEKIADEPGRIVIKGDDDLVYQANYLSGTCTRFILLLDRFTLDEPSDAYEKIDRDFSKVIASGKTFAVRVHREGDHDFSSPDVAREAGQAVVDRFEEETGETLDVDLDDPDIVFRLDLFDDRAYFGVDTTGRSLNDRSYLKSEARTPPVLANCIVQSSDWEPGQSLLDPFCDAGTIPIEAGRIACHIPNAQRKFAFLDMPFFDGDRYAEVAQEAKEQMDLHSVNIEGSDHEIIDAKQNAKSAGLHLRFRDTVALERDLDADHIVFHAPFLPQRSKRDEIKSYLRDFEQKFLASDAASATCFTQDKDFFVSFDDVTKIAVKNLEGWLLHWRL